MMEYILAVDASFSCTGWTILEKRSREVIDIGKITTTTKFEENDRMLKIASVLLDRIRKYSIKEVCIEDGYVYINKRTGMQLSKLRGALIMALRLEGCNIKSMQPGSIKKSFMGEGKGNAPKEEVAGKVLALYPNNKLVQSLGEFNDKNNKAKNSDMYDSISIGVAYLIDEEDNKKSSAS